MTSARPLIIGTRGSKLALWQAEHIASRLKASGHPCELRIITTKGDQVQHLGFDKLEGKGFFTKELEEALINGSIDLAVHSCKDLETRGPEELVISAIAGRAACEELMIVRREAVDQGRALFVRERANVGTSSARRKSQLKAFRPDVRISDLRGNVPTRVEKLRSGAYDAILLAKAGIDRLDLDLSDLAVFTLDARWFIPAPAQGALAVQTRKDDARTIEAARSLHDDEAAATAECERAVLRAYHGGCQVPLGVHVTKRDHEYAVWASASREWNEMPRRIHLRGDDPAALAKAAVLRMQSSIRPTSVNITRAIKGDEPLVRMLAPHGIKVIGVPFFEAEAIGFKMPMDQDRIFFTSRNAVRYFAHGGGTAAEVAMRDTPCDAIGSGTADELRKHGAEPGFIGDGPDTPTIAREYAQRFHAARVLFPCAAEGQRPVQSALVQENVTDLHVYRMRANTNVHVPVCDVVILTSPDSAEAFFSLIPFPRFTQCIAMGTSTAQRIKEISGRASIIPWSSNEMALIDAVFNIATDQPH